MKRAVATGAVVVLLIAAVATVALPLPEMVPVDFTVPVAEVVAPLMVCCVETGTSMVSLPNGVNWAEAGLAMVRVAAPARAGTVNRIVKSRQGAAGAAEGEQFPATYRNDMLPAMQFRHVSKWQLTFAPGRY